MKKEFTATIHILKEQKTLLLFHKKHNKWLPPGGHMEPGELPYETALREAHEETGLIVEPIFQENVWIGDLPHCRSFPRPYLCLIENIPATLESKAHQHIDLIYIGRPIGGNLQCNPKEAHALRWFALNDLDRLERGAEIFEDTYTVSKHLLVLCQL